jgi:hypothetical protein
MPAGGTVSYAGTSQVTVQDDLTLYDLTGSATVVADFGSGTVDSTVSGLSGLRDRRQHWRGASRSGHRPPDDVRVEHVTAVFRDPL